LVTVKKHMQLAGAQADDLAGRTGSGPADQLDGP
jgi:hypothetical protein